MGVLNKILPFGLQLFRNLEIDAGCKFALSAYVRTEFIEQKWTGQEPKPNASHEGRSPVDAQLDN